MIGIMNKKFIERLITQSTQRRTLTQGSYLFHQNDPVNSIFIIEEGSVELTRHQQDGSLIILQRATRHTILAEASLYSKVYHCDAIVELPSSVFQLPKIAFLKQLREDDEFAYLWAAHLAREVQSARYRSELLTRKTVAERLNGWLDWQGEGLPPKGQWKSIAIQIGVSPEALYRELAKRRSEK